MSRTVVNEVKFRIYNSTLDPKVWDENMVLKPDVRAILLKVAQDFYRNTELKAPILDILFLGSTTNYNWTPTSDIDLHIVIDITKETIDPKLARQFMDGLGAGWNNNHEISIKGHPVEVYLQDIREKNSTPAQARKGSTIYSILKNCWLKRPDRSRIDIDKEAIKQKYHKVKGMVDDFVTDKNVDKLKKLMKALKNYRNAGLEQVGEFSTENLVFKALRHTGVITKLKDSINTLYDKSVTMNESGQQPYLLVGLTNDELQVSAKADFVGSKHERDMPPVQHGGFSTPGFREREKEAHWRYKSANNTLYWFPHKWLMVDDELREKIQDTTLGYLKTKHHINNPKQSWQLEPYFKGGHFINESVRMPDGLILGNIDDDGINHVQVYRDAAKSGNHKGRGFRWRYRTHPAYKDFIFWWDDPLPYHREVVADFLKNKYGAPSNVKHRSLDQMSNQFADILHGYQNTPSDDDKYYLKQPEDWKSYYLKEDEDTVLNHLYIGLITSDFDIRIKKARREHTRHATLFSWRELGEPHRPFRYRSDLNELFWWDDPTPQEKEEVVAYIQKYFGVTKSIKHTTLPSLTSVLWKGAQSKYGDDDWKRSHPIDEGFNPRKDLYLGWVNRSNLKVAGFNISIGDDETHHNYLQGMPPEWRGESDANLIRWRYRKDTNTIWWWSGTPPTDDEKVEVEHWIETNLKVKKPAHKQIVIPPFGHPKYPYGMGYYDAHGMNESKFDPFTAKSLDFVTFGGLSLTKQKGYGKEDPSFHSPPARRGIYAFVWPYIEKFLLGGSYADPKQRGKGQRQRMQYVKDKEGNVITSDHPEFQKHGEKNKNWSFTRTKDNEPWDSDKHDYEKETPLHVLYNNAYRKKFKYEGELWHNLGEFVREDRILDRKGEWVKTDMATFKEALKKELHRTMTWDASQAKGKQFRGLGTSSHIWDNLEVFIDQKI